MVWYFTKQNPPIILKVVGIAVFVTACRWYWFGNVSSHIISEWNFVMYEHILWIKTSSHMVVVSIITNRYVHWDRFVGPESKDKTIFRVYHSSPAGQNLFCCKSSDWVGSVWASFPRSIRWLIQQSPENPLNPNSFSFLPIFSHQLGRLISPNCFVQICLLIRWPKIRIIQISDFSLYCDVFFFEQHHFCPRVSNHSTTLIINK